MRDRTRMPRWAPTASSAPKESQAGDPAFAPLPSLASAKSGRLSGDARLPPAYRPGSVVEKPPLPADLRAGIERLARVSLDGVAVHYNSSEPARHQALAFAKGNEIHLAPGQEKNLPHEAWHVAQQRQGRVPPTVQEGERRINDDPALEREADVMGLRAFQLHAKESPARQEAPSLGGMPVPASPVMQMLYKPAVGDAEALLLAKWLEKINSPTLDWRVALDEVYDYIEAARETLEDDEDRATLLEKEQEVDLLAAKLDQATQGFSLLPDLDETEINTRTKAKKRKQSQSVTKWEEVNVIRDQIGELRNLHGEIGTLFPLAGGGFSATGRAHDMEESEVPKAGHNSVSTWFDNITLGGVALSATRAVYKAPNKVKVAEQAGNPVLPLEVRQAAPADKLPTMENLIGKDLDQNQSFNLERAPGPRDRGDGQFVNMGYANASAYAQLAGIGNWQQSKWEWLHVRAASLGGETDGTNLVVGTRDVNTQMMPFESNIRLLGNIVAEDKKHERYKSLKASFKVSPPANPAKHKVDSITLRWELVKGDKAPGNVQEVGGEAKFSPLRTNASISKTEAGILESVLKEERAKTEPD